MGQVYAVNNLLSSLLITLCVGLYSPFLVVMSLQGATLGSLLPLAFQSPEQFSQVYNGLWGYSSILSMACVSSVSIPFSKESIGAGYINILATVFIQKMLGDLMVQVKKPIFDNGDFCPTFLERSSSVYSAVHSLNSSSASCLEV